MFNEPGDPISVDTRHQLEGVRNRLLDLHKILLEGERKAHERVHGRVASNELLPLVLEDEAFAWLRALSETVVRIDEMLDTDDPVTEGEATGLMHQLRDLLTPVEGGEGFSGQYDQALQQEPAAVLAHGAVWRLLPPADE